MRRVTIDGDEADLKKLREAVNQAENDPKSSAEHKKRMRKMLEAAEERHALALTTSP